MCLYEAPLTLIISERENTQDLQRFIWSCKVLNKDKHSSCLSSGHLLSKPFISQELKKLTQLQPQRYTLLAHKKTTIQMLPPQFSPSLLIWALIFCRETLYRDLWSPEDNDISEPAGQSSETFPLLPSTSNPQKVTSLSSSAVLPSYASISMLSIQSMEKLYILVFYFIFGTYFTQCHYCYQICITVFRFDCFINNPCS